MNKLERLNKIKQYIDEVDQRVIDIRCDMRDQIVSGYDYIEARVKAEILEEVSSDLKSILELEED